MKHKLFVVMGMILLLSVSFAYAKTMIVRVYVKNYQQLSERINFKYTNIEIAGAKPHQSYDLIVEQEDYPVVLASGLKHDIVVADLEAQKEGTRYGYRSLDSINIALRNLVNTYPSLCVLDSLGLSYQNRQMYGVKISDNPSVSEPSEPGVFICGLHHSREWATIEVCLFFADSILRAYNTVPSMQNLINNHEIWVFPAINPDGYAYDYPAQRSWRKNRQPFNSVIGTDINRNYMGACNGDRFGLWGALTVGAQSAHSPSSETFMGGYGASSPEITNVINFFKTHNINTSHSFHSYSELVLWPWGYQEIPTPDNALYVRIGQTMAGMISALGGGTYTPEQTPDLYPVSSGCDDWIYGWNRFINGIPCLAFTNEVGTSFYQPVSNLSSILHENFEAIYFLANFSDSVRIYVKPAVPAPQVSVPETSATGDFTISWQPKNSEYANPNSWEVQEFNGYSVFTDSLEGLPSAWTMQGFSLSTRRARSGTHSLYSDSANNISNYARTTFPYLVQPGDSLTFWCWYNLERNYDAAVAEVSFDTKEWFQLGARMTDTAISWRRKAYSLAPYTDKSVYIQFRVMTDDNTLRNGFYLDDVSPVPLFNNTRIISSTITDTFCNVTVLNQGNYWYQVRGSNLTNGWGMYSTLQGVVVLTSAISEGNDSRLDIGKVTFNLFPNPFSNSATIRYSVPVESKVSLKVFDVQGRNRAELVNSTHKAGNYQISWDGRTLNRNKLASGVYFLELNVSTTKLTKRAILF
jgi:hypothetical protein